MANQTISVEPAADFGCGHGALVIAGNGQRVRINRADRVVYVSQEWGDRVNAGEFPWAEMTCAHRHRDEDRRRDGRKVACPWVQGAALKIRAVDRNVIYKVIGACGPQVRAYLCQMPD